MVSLITDANAPIKDARPQGPIIKSGPVSPDAAQSKGFSLSGEHLDYQPDQQSAAAPQSIGGNLRDSWNSFIDHPESRAGLMQFAVNMLAGRGFAESLGGGAEAMGRNVTAQQEQEQAEEKLALEERKTAAREVEAGAYAKKAGSEEGDTDEKFKRRLLIGDQLQKQKDWQNWRLGKNEDTTGLQKDPVIAYVNRKLGKAYKTRDEVLSDPAAAQAAQDYHFGRESAPPQAGSREYGPNGPRPVYKGNVIVGYYQNGKYTPGRPPE